MLANAMADTNDKPEAPTLTLIPTKVLPSMPDNSYNVSGGKQCTAHNRSGNQCGRKAIRGGNVCYMHGGNAPQVREKAIERVNRARDLFAEALIARVEEYGDFIDPRILLAGTLELNKLSELLSGRATERTESKITKSEFTQQVRAEFKMMIDQVSERVQVEVEAE